MIDLEDDDFGLWYLDAMDNPEKYKGKTVRFTGQVYRGRAFANDLMVPGRFAMTCCADDIAFIGFVCSLLPALIVDRINRKKTPRIRIVTVNRCESSGMDE